MKRTFFPLSSRAFRILVVGIIAAALIVPAEAIAEDSNPAQLRISCPSRKILPRQPLRLLIEAKVTRHFTGELNLHEPLLTIESSDGRHTLPRYALATGIYIDGFGNRKGTPYSLNYTAYDEVLVLYYFHKSTYLFPQPGKYKIQVLQDMYIGDEMENSKFVRLESNLLEVHVVAPKEKEKAAAALWEKLVIREGPTLDKAEALKLIEAYPKTSYAQYARYYLAQNETLPAAERVALLKEVAEGKSSAPIGDLALVQIANLFYSQANYAESREYVHKILNLTTASEKSKEEALQLLDFLKYR
jgi:hypothetical protein